MNSVEKLEKLTCVKLVLIVRKKYRIDDIQLRYDKAYEHYKSMVLCRNRKYISPTLLLDGVAYVNALARYAATRGIQLREIH